METTAEHCFSQSICCGDYKSFSIIPVCLVSSDAVSSTNIVQTSDVGSDFRSISRRQCQQRINNKNPLLFSHTLHNHEGWITTSTHVCTLQFTTTTKTEQKWSEFKLFWNIQSSCVWFSELLLTYGLHLKSPVSVAKLAAQWVIMVDIKPRQWDTSQTSTSFTSHHKVTKELNHCCERCRCKS